MKQKKNYNVILYYIMSITLPLVNREEKYYSNIGPVFNQMVSQSKNRNMIKPMIQSAEPDLNQRIQVLNLSGIDHEAVIHQNIEEPIYTHTDAQALKQIEDVFDLLPPLTDEFNITHGDPNINMDPRLRELMKLETLNRARGDIIDEYALQTQDFINYIRTGNENYINDLYTYEQKPVETQQPEQIELNKNIVNLAENVATNTILGRDPFPGFSDLFDKSEPDRSKLISKEKLQSETLEPAGIPLFNKRPDKINRRKQKQK